MMAGKNSIKIVNVIVSAWQQLKGAKGPIWASLSLYFILYLATQIAGILISGLVSMTAQYVVLGHIGNKVENLPFTLQVPIILTSIVFILIIPLLVAAPALGRAYMKAIKQVRGEKIGRGTSYHYPKCHLQIFNCILIKAILQFILIVLGAITITVVGIIHDHVGCHSFICQTLFALITVLIFLLLASLYYLLLFTIPLTIDKNYSTLKAQRCSIKLTFPHLLPIFSTFLITFIGYCLITAICLAIIVGIPLMMVKLFNITLMPFATFSIVLAIILIISIILVWLIPNFYLLTAELYCRIVDRTEKPLEEPKC